MLPQHIISPLSKLLLLKGPKETRLCLNHPNIYYAVKPLITGTREFRNLSLLIPASADQLASLRKTIIFFDDKRKLDGACHFLQKQYSQLMDPVSGQHQVPPAARTLVMGYHSDMSSMYLQSTYEDFNAPEGSCRILCATSSAAMVRPVNIPIFARSQQLFRVSIFDVSRSSFSTACVKICACRYNVLGAVPGIQTFTASSFTCPNHGR